MLRLFVRAWDQLGSLLSGQALDQHPAVTGAAVAGAMEEALGKRISVLMPYIGLGPSVWPLVPSTVGGKPG